MQKQASAERGAAGWLLFAFRVPTALVALCYRSGLRPTKKNPQNFYRKFNGLPSERAEARKIVGALKAAGLSIKWVEIEEAEVPREVPLLRPVRATAHEERRQAELLAQRDAYDRARDALRRAQGG